jgi:superfamily II DNA helicase RecQ
LAHNTTFTFCIRDVDLVVHWGLPTSSLAYWQEIGQCGRDGRDSYAICYAYKMLISKLQNKEFKELVDLDSCIRTHILQTLLLDGMG